MRTYRKVLRKVRHHGRRVRERYLVGYTFVHINKTGGSSVEQALGLPFEHKTAREKKEELGDRRWNQRFSFSFVRNPWDRVASLYHYRVRTNTSGLGSGTIDFNTWVRLTFHDQDPAFYNSPKMLMPQAAWLCDDANRLLVDFVGRFEALEEDFETVCTQIGRRATLPHLKRSTRGPYRSQYDDDAIAIVEAWFEEDIDRFGYAF